MIGEVELASFGMEDLLIDKNECLNSGVIISPGCTEFAVTFAPSCCNRRVSSWVCSMFASFD